MNIRTIDRKIVQRDKQAQAAQEAGRQARNAYAREWRAKNRDKVKQYNVNYWLRKAERQRASC